MTKIYKFDEEDYNERGSHDDHILERVFKEGCEHGYKKAMREMEGYEEKGGRSRLHYKEGFEEKIEKLKKKYE